MVIVIVSESDGSVDGGRVIKLNHCYEMDQRYKQTRSQDFESIRAVPIGVEAFEASVSGAALLPAEDYYPTKTQLP